MVGAVGYGQDHNLMDMNSILSVQRIFFLSSNNKTSLFLELTCLPKLKGDVDDQDLHEQYIIP